MGFELAAPGMLAGLALLALPIIAHLTGYQEVRRVVFPTLRFLVATQQKVRRRTRLEAFLLLLLRLLAVLALVLLFARPTMTWTAKALAGTDPARTTVVLLDTSASMQARLGDGTTFDLARERAREVLTSLQPGTGGALLSFSHRVDVLGPGLTESPDALLDALDEVEAGASGTDLTSALRRARELLRDEGVGAANVLVLSDGLGAPPAGLQDWPEDIAVHYHDLRGAPLRNVFPDDADVTAGARRGEGLKIQTMLRAAGEPPDASVGVVLDLGAGIEVAGDVDFAGSHEAEHVFTLAVPPESTLEATLRVEDGDDLPVDDALAFTLAGESDLPVLLVSGDGGTHPRDQETYYLERALQPGAGSLSRVRPRVVSSEELRRIDGGRGDVVVLANVPDPEPLADELRAFVERGGGLLISLGPRVDGERYSQVLGDLLPAELTEVKSKGRGTFEQSPVGLALPPLEDETFRVFRSGGASVFSSVRFGKVHGVAPRLADEARVLLRYSDGLPALLERQVGEGRVILFTSSLDDDWTDLPLRSIFVPLVHQLVRSLSGTLLLDGGAVVDAGGQLSLPVPSDPSMPAWVVLPDGTEDRLETGAADADGRVVWAGASQPGHHALWWGVATGSDEGVVRMVFSVRVPSAESGSPSLRRDALLAAVPGLVHHSAGDEAEESEGEAVVVRSASMIPSLLLMLALAMLGEGALTGRRT